jgi:hypothetical protein
MEANDVTARATESWAGRVLESLPHPPPEVRITLTQRAASRITNNVETQFRIVLRNPDGTFFTNRNDRCVVARPFVSSRQCPMLHRQRPADFVTLATAACPLRKAVSHPTSLPPSHFHRPPMQARGAGLL